MISKISAILGGVLVLQLIIWALVSSNPHHVTEKKDFLSTDTSQVNFVKIKNKEGELTLKRVGDNWRISDPYNYPANPSYIETLLNKLAELKYESLITKNKDKFEEYEVAGEEAAYVEVGKEGGLIDKFYCGKPSKHYTHTYMKLEGENEVWMVSGTPRSSFTRKPKDWRDKQILNLDKTLIERVLLRFPDEVVELRREISMAEADTMLVEADTSWTVIPERGKPFLAAEKVMNRIKNTLGKMNSMDFRVAGTDSIPSFAEPLLTVEAYLEGDRKEVIDFVQDPEKDNRYVVRQNGSEETVFVVYESSFKNFNKRLADFVEEEKDEES